MISRDDFLKLPVMYFGMPMGLLGIALEIRHLENLLNIERHAGWFALGYSWSVLAIMVLMALFRMRNAQGRHFYKSQWFGSTTVFDFSILTMISMMFLMSINPFRTEHSVWGLFFYLIMVIQIFLNISFIKRWIHDHSFEVTHFRVSVFILLSGNFMVAITGHYYLPETHHEMLWLYFASSLLLWFVFLYILLYRLFFEEVLPAKLRPSLFIFLSPPSLGVVALALLTDMSTPSILSWAMFYGAFFFFLLWLYSFSHFRNIQLSMVGWAYIFPLAAFDMAAQFVYLQTEQTFFLVLAVLVLLVNIAIAIFLTTHMIKAFIKPVNPQL